MKIVALALVGVVSAKGGPPAVSSSDPVTAPAVTAPAVPSKADDNVKKFMEDEKKRLVETQEQKVTTLTDKKKVLVENTVSANSARFPNLPTTM